MVATAKLTGVGDVFRELEAWKREAHRSVFEATANAMSTFHQKVARENLGSGGIDSAPLRRALKSETKGAGNVITGRVYFREGKWEPIARIHETGGTIRPKRVKHLTVPTKYAKRKYGKRHGRGVRRLPRIKKTFVRRLKSGNLGAFERVGSDAKLLFVLVKKVTLKPRLGFYKAWGKYEPKAHRMVQRAAEAAVKRARL